MTDWIQCGFTRRENFDNLERRYKLVFLDYVFVDRLFCEIPGIAHPGEAVDFEKRLAFFQACIDVLGHGTMPGAEVFAFGFDYAKASWMILVWQKNFPMVRDNEYPQTLELIVQLGDPYRIKEAYQHKLETGVR